MSSPIHAELKQFNEGNGQLDLCAQEKLESYNPFSLAVKMNYSPPSISAWVLISFQMICIQQQLRRRRIYGRTA